MWLNEIDYSFEVVKSWKDDLMSSSDQTDCSQQLQHQRLCPDAMAGIGLERQKKG